MIFFLYYTFFEGDISPTSIEQNFRMPSVLTLIDISRDKSEEAPDASQEIFFPLKNDKGPPMIPKYIEHRPWPYKASPTIIEHCVIYGDKPLSLPFITAYTPVKNIIQSSTPSLKLIGRFHFDVTDKKNQTSSSPYFIVKNDMKIDPDIKQTPPDSMYHIIYDEPVVEPITQPRIYPIMKNRISPFSFFTQPKSLQPFVLYTPMTESLIKPILSAPPLKNFCGLDYFSILGCPPQSSDKFSFFEEEDQDGKYDHPVLSSIKNHLTSSIRDMI